MGITVKRILDSVVVQEQVSFREEVLEECRQKFMQLADSGKIEGEFEDDIWKANNEVKGRFLDFSFNDFDYDYHAGEELGFSVQTMKEILKCYVLYRHGMFILPTLSMKLIDIKAFLVNYGEDDFAQSVDSKKTVEDFLWFVGIPEERVEEILGLTLTIDSRRRTGQRKLAPGINYEAIAYEIETIYSGNVDDELFIKYFPVYFWVNVTYVFPLRATEMLVTPLNCLLFDENGAPYLLLRRTKLKYHRLEVHYEVEKDYKYEKIPFPCPDIIGNIQKYITLTASTPRRFLFSYGNQAKSKMLSLDRFNDLLKAFVSERLVGNEKYSFARYASGIKEFEFVTAGDSRPMAISNIRFQGFSEEMCRQLAGHLSINTTAGYASNVLDTILASSIYKFMHQMKSNRDLAKNAPPVSLNHQSLKPECTSPNKGTIVDCEKGGFVEDCFGCEYYNHPEEETEQHLEMERNKAMDVLSDFFSCLTRVYEVRHSDDRLFGMFLETQKAMARYGLACDEKIKEMFRKWQEIQNTQKT